MAHNAPPPNQLGNYRLIRPIGTGRFATVYVAKHTDLRKFAAVKVLNGISDKDLFRQEAQILTDLSHPNVLHVFDFGIEGDTAYIVMVYALNSLRLRHPHGTIVELPAVLSYTHQVASALQYAHEQRIIHRHVKPENMLIGQQFAVFLSDFGMASFDSSHTQDVAATLAYIAPEQITGHPCPASDQYALAITVYEWLCGRPPFVGGVAEITAQHLSASPPPLHNYAPSISLEVEEVVLQALAKDPDQRFTSVMEFANALKKASEVETYIPAILAEKRPVKEQEVEIHSLETVVATVEPRTSANFVENRPAKEQEVEIHNLETVAATHQQKPPQRISRRALITTAAIGIGNVAVLTVAALTLLHSSPPQRTLASSTATPTPTPTPDLTPPVIPTPSAGTSYVIFLGHGAPVYSTAWSSDGRRLASGGADNSVLIWRVSNGTSQTLTNRYQLAYQHLGPVNHVAWSPAGTRVASASDDKTARVWNGINRSNILTYTGHTDSVHSAVWSPDGTRIASASNDTTVQVWNASDGSNILTYRGHTAPVWDVAWSPDGKLIASASSDKTVRIWNASNGSTILTYWGHSDTTTCVAWSPDATSLASGSADGTVKVCNPNDGSTQMTYSHNGAVYSVAWAHNGRSLASGSADKTVQIWTVSDGTTLYTYRGHRDTIFGITWSPDGTRIASASNDKTVRVWQA